MDSEELEAHIKKLRAVARVVYDRCVPFQNIQGQEIVILRYCTETAMGMQS